MTRDINSRFVHIETYPLKHTLGVTVTRKRDNRKFLFSLNDDEAEQMIASLQEYVTRTA